MPFATLRRTKRLWLEPVTLERRGIFWAGGLAIGLIAALFAEAADAIQATFQELVHRWPYLVLVATPVGMGVSLWATRRFFPGAEGSGIPQAMAARTVPDPDIRHSLVSLRIATGKVLLTLVGLAVGASVGREGPTVQVGASLMHAAGGVFRGRIPGLLLAGGAAGVAAAFNTPLAGIVFAIEEMGRRFETRTSALVLAAVAMGGLAALGLEGDYLYFGQTTLHLIGWRDWLLVPLAGLVGGVCGGLFSRLTIGYARGRFAAVLKRRPVLTAFGCGLAIAVIGLCSGGQTYGTGYNEARALITGQAGAGLFGPAKWAATLLSSLSGIPGGIFSPSLAAGAGIGADLAVLIPGASVAAAALLGMVAYFSGVVQAPITAFVIVLEMTDNHAMVVPLMLASLMGTGVSRLIGAEPIYHGLAHGFAATASRALATKKAEALTKEDAKTGDQPRPA